MADNSALQVGGAIPQGATIGGGSTNPPPISNSLTVGSPIPQGATIGTPQPDVSSEFNTDPNQTNPLNAVGATLNSVGAGVGEGLLGTIEGGLHLGKKLLTSTGMYADTPDAPINKAINLIDSRRQELAHDNANNPIERGIGYGGETLAEFLLGDEALKGLSASEKMLQTAKTLKVFEKSPKLMAALKIGANALNAGVRTGAVQGAQTLVRSGGDVGEAAKDAATAGVTGGVIGGATGAIGEALGSAGETAQKAIDLSEAAGNADTKAEVAKSIGEKIDQAKNQLHSGYESGIQDLQSRLGDTEIDPVEDNPLAEKAQELLADPVPEDHPVVTQAKEAAGDKLDKKVRDLLETIATGKLPVDEEDIAEAAEKSKPSGLLGADGKPTNPTEVEPEGKDVEPYKINDLVQLRQTIRNLADSYEYGDINSRVLRKLINGMPNEGNAMDDTIEKLAENSGDDTAVQDYKDLRSNYRDKINLFEEPVIQNLRDGKMDDAAKAFVGVARDGSALPTAGKVRFNVDNLRGIIGDDGVHKFAKQVFGTMLQDSVENGRFNPAKFVKTFNRVSEETKGPQFFDLEGANKGLGKLYKDAQSASALQHLTRAGVLVPAAGMVGAATGGGIGLGIGSLLGLTVAEGGGLQAGRDLLNYVANHPAVWKMYKTAGRVANSKGAGSLAEAARVGGAKAAVGVRRSFSPYSSAAQNLAGR